MLQVADNSDIVIRLRMGKSRAVVWRDFIAAMDTLEAALYESDRDDIQMFAKELNLPGYVRDACLERLRQFQGRRLLINGAREGSIEIAAIVAGISIYVLDKTVGESIKDAFKKSRAHAELSDFIRSYGVEKFFGVVERIRQAFSEKGQSIRVRLVHSETSINKIDPDRDQILVEVEEDCEADEIGSLSEQIELLERLWKQSKSR